MTKTICLFSFLTVNVDQEANHFFDIVQNKFNFIKDILIDSSGINTTINILGKKKISRNGMHYLGRSYLFKKC